ncbi:YoaK family protein [Piscinibacter sp. XHJ-5]|uniref:YoaK family protein n=1 Tax=Piscinibacter sp. XHJ-5 TaxID=3037797 RepID=UPI002452D200|nr:YoaK family protein [Piscinibacter sp. XHJ-5]
MLVAWQDSGSLQVSWLSRPSVVASSLGFVAGYVDTVGFIALFGLFTAHVTGNFVLLGSEIAHPTHGVLVKLLAFPAFIAAVAASRLLALLAARQGRSPAGPLLLLQSVLLSACMLAGWRAQPIVDAAAPWVLVTGVLGAAAMGVQNAASRLAFGALAPTTVMTGNVTQLVIDAVDLLRGAGDEAVRGRIGKFLWPAVAFGTGAICGAIAHLHAALWALGLPLLILMALAAASVFRTSDRQQPGPRFPGTA